MKNFALCVSIIDWPLEFRFLSIKRKAKIDHSNAHNNRTNWSLLRADRRQVDVHSQREVKLETIRRRVRSLTLENIAENSRARSLNDAKKPQTKQRRINLRGRKNKRSILFRRCNSTLIVGNRLQRVSNWHNNGVFMVDSVVALM